LTDDATAIDSSALSVDDFPRLAVFVADLSQPYAIIAEIISASPTTNTLGNAFMTFEIRRTSSSDC